MADLDVDIQIGGAGNSAPAAPEIQFGGNGSGRPAPPEKPRSKDPHLGLRFWVQLGQIEIAGFQECTGFGMQTDVTEYPEGGLNTHTHKLPVRVKQNNITLKRGIDEGHDLYRWYRRFVHGEVERQNISIIIYDSLGKQVRKWDLRRAFPCKWTGPDLKSDHGAVAVETVEIAYEGILPT